MSKGAFESIDSLKGAIRSAIEQSGSRVERRRAEHRLSAQAHAIGLLNELEGVLNGWVLQIDFDREWVEKQLGPIYEKLDQD